MAKLVASIKSNNGKIIKTRFFYVDEKEQRDVTLELCDAIEYFNEKAMESNNKGEYALTIPFDFKNGLAVYSYGCGLTHYLQESEFVKLSQYVKSFNLEKCTLSVFTPDDVKSILESNDNSHLLGEKIQSYYYK